MVPSVDWSLLCKTHLLCVKGSTSFAVDFSTPVLWLRAVRNRSKFEGIVYYWVCLLTVGSKSMRRLSHSLEWKFSEIFSFKLFINQYKQHDVDKEAKKLCREHAL